MVIQLVIIQVVTFVGLILVLRLLFYRHLDSALTRLKRLHEENLAREEQLKKESENIRQERDLELINAKKEAERIIKEAKDKSAKIGINIEEQAKEQAQRTLERAKVEIKKFENESIDKSQEEAIELSIEILKFTFTRQGKEIFQHQLISELIDEIEKLEPDKFTVKTNQVKLLSAYSLTKEESRKLTRILSDKLGVPVELEEIVDPEIIVGLIIQIGALTIDGSLRNKLKKVIPYLKGAVSG